MSKRGKVRPTVPHSHFFHHDHRSKKARNLPFAGHVGRMIRVEFLKKREEQTMQELDSIIEQINATRVII